MVKRDEIKKEDIIGEREYSGRGVEIFAAVAAVVFMLLAALGFWASESYDYTNDADYLDPGMVGIGIFCLVLAVLFAVFAYKGIKERRQNNRNPNPAIVIMEDGVFILFQANGRKEYLKDKIVDVTAGRHISFIMENPDGVRYTKSIRHVHSRGVVVTRIKNILSYNDGKHTYTNYEKARLFCAYCGSKVDIEKGKCSSCGGKTAL